MVVSNSGPLIALGKLGFLDILGHLYEKVKIPRAVYTAYRQEFFSLDELRIIFDTIIKRNDIWIAEGLCRSVLDRLTNSNND